MAGLRVPTVLSKQSLSNVGNKSRGQIRSFASATTQPPLLQGSRSHRVVVVGGGAAGLAVSHQLLRNGKFAADSIAIVDPAKYHHYQPGWTLVGGGLKTKEQLRRPLSELIDPKLKFYQEAVANFNPEQNIITLGNGDSLAYDQLVIAPGIKISIDKIDGLRDALTDPHSSVSTIYSYDHCSKVFPKIEQLNKGTAIFTQPSGVVKCAGAPQKVMWLALDHWKRRGLCSAGQEGQSAINITFATALPVMFGVPKYSKALEQLRQEREVEGLFGHDLVAVRDRTAIFKSGGSEVLVTKPFDFLHVVPKMEAHDFLKNSALSNDVGFVDVNEDTLQHKSYSNVWGLGDAAALPTSKTAAAITAQAPVLVQNLLNTMSGSKPQSSYDGYTSCPLTTGDGKVMLAEFKYGAEPKETFGNLFGIDQAVPRRAFYHLKKDFFPWVYYKSLVKGTWAGPKGWSTSSAAP